MPYALSECNPSTTHVFAQYMAVVGALICAAGSMIEGRLTGRPGDVDVMPIDDHMCPPILLQVEAVQRTAIATATAVWPAASTLPQSPCRSTPIHLHMCGGGQA
jgi:hypothetical protein